MKILLAFALMLLFYFNSNSQQLEKNQDANFSEEQISRRNQSEEIIKRKGVQINPALPLIDSEAEAKIRSQDEVVDRALALCYVSLKGEGLDEKFLTDFDRNFKARNKLSPEEMRFAENKEPTRQELTDSKWRYESLVVMLWTLGYIDTLNHPDSICDVQKIVLTILNQKDEASFRKNAKLRSKKEILDQADLIYRLDWACVEAKLKNTLAPGNLDPDVVYERHYSFNWLTYYMDDSWDEITTDT